MHELDFHTEHGSVRVIDFMPPRGQAPDVVRIVEGLEGSVPMRMELVIRFDYGSIVPWVRRLEDDTRIAIAGPDAVAFRTPVDVRGENLSTVADFTAEPGERIPFVLTWFPSHLDPPRAITPDHAYQDTCEYWDEWLVPCTFGGRYADAVFRSLMVLKAMTYAPTGGIVAAPTTSLPEQIGGVRNWDYRYCWLRDASFALSALVGNGFVEEAGSWRAWLLRAVAGDPEDIQIMYGPAGERRLLEFELPWLDGYEGSKPVRVGNGASTQFQLDVYGEVADVLYQARRRGLPADDSAWALLRHLIQSLETRWQEPDEGIWEVRGPRRHFTHSKVMAWVAFDRGLRLIDELGRDGPEERWLEIRDTIKAEVLERGFDEELGSFVQSYDSKRLDASLLTIPLYGFLPADDPRVRGTLEAIRRELLVDGFVQRYRHDDGRRVGRRPAAGRGRLLPLLVLVRGQPDPARRARRGVRDVRAAALAPQRPRAALGGVRPEARAARRQLPAGVLAHRARQHGAAARRRSARAGRALVRLTGARSGAPRAARRRRRWRRSGARAGRGSRATRRRCCGCP